jgi:hypothetical protein
MKTALKRRSGAGPGVRGRGPVKKDGENRRLGEWETEQRTAGAGCYRDPPATGAEAARGWGWGTGVGVKKDPNYPPATAGGTDKAYTCN